MEVCFVDFHGIYNNIGVNSHYENESENIRIYEQVWEGINLGIWIVNVLVIIISEIIVFRDSHKEHIFDNEKDNIEQKEMV